MAAKKTKRVRLVNRYGTIATPLASDVQAWIDKGWSLVDDKMDSVAPSGNVPDGGETVKKETD